MEYIFYQGLDSADGDIAKVQMSAENYPETLNAESLPQNLRGIPCFNTLGYLKGKVGEIKPSPYFSSKDGLYIKNVLNEIPIKVINLDRRPDRWEKTKKTFEGAGINDIERFSAVDGTKLEMTDQIKHLFRGNDFQYRQGFIGCALSHIQLWEQLVKSDKNHFLIFEDDIEVVDEFKKKLNVVYNHVLQNPFNEVTFLGYSFWQGNPEKSNNYPDLKVMQSKSYMGGFYSYIISKSGALKLLNQIKLYGVQNGIDRFMHLHFDKMQVFNTEPHLVHTSVAMSGNTVDSDIQRNTNPVGVKTYDINNITTPVLPKDSKESKPISVKLITNWSSSKDLVKTWSKMSQDGNGRWNSIQITDSNDADYFAIINKPGPPEYYNPKKTMVFQMEPWVNDETKNWGVKTWGKWSNPDPKVFWKVLTHKYHHNLGEWHLNKTYKELGEQSSLKSKIISTFVSDKNFDEGHIKRLSLLKFLEEKDFEIDIFGKGSLDYKNGKGPVEFKDEGLFSYKYTICVENNSEHNYITEKLYDGVLAECLCFYWGAPNVTDYIDNEAIILLDLNDFEKSYEIIKNAIKNNEWEKRIDCVRKAKVKILNEMNVFACLEKVIKSNTDISHSSVIQKTPLYEVKSSTSKEWGSFISATKIPQNRTVYFNVKGRFTNNLFQYFAAEIIRRIYNFDKVEIYSGNKQGMIMDNLKFRQIGKAYIEGKEIKTEENTIILDGFFQYSEIFLHFRDYIKSIFVEGNMNKINSQICIDDIVKYKSKHSPVGDKDLVMHLRLDDFRGDNQIFDAFELKNLIRNIHYEKLYIVCDTIKADWEREYLKYFEELNPTMINGNTLDDFKFIMNSKKLLLSASTFSWMGAYLGFDNEAEIHIPYNSFHGENQNLAEFNDKCKIYRGLSYQKF